MLTPSSVAPTLRVAIYRTSSIGDVVLATACLDLLRQLSVPTEITWIGRGAPLEMLKALMPELRTLEVRRGDAVADTQRVMAALDGIHLFIDLQCNLRSRWLGRQLKATRKVPVFLAEKSQLARSRLLLEARLRGRRRPLPEASRKPARLQFETMCDALRRGLHHHLPVEMRDGLDAIVARPRLPVSEAVDPTWRKELRFGGWLGVAPGAAHPTKQAPFAVMGEVLGLIKKAAFAAGSAGITPPLGLVFFGDSQDRQVARQLLDELDWRGPVLNLAGKLSLWETAVAISETSCLLSNDSSLGHIAEAVDTPTAILFGPTIESFGFPPHLPQSRAFSSLLGCRPCSKHGKVPCRYDDRLCFTSLASERIADHLLTLITAHDARHLRRQPLGTSHEAHAKARVEARVEPSS